MVIRFWGGLGNCMFIWCRYRQLEFEGHKVKADLNWFKRNPDRQFELTRAFDIKPKIANWFDIFKAKINGDYLIGYWQNRSYFQDINPHREFPLFGDKIYRAAMHKRRGDYIDHPIHDVDLRKYYAKAYDYVGYPDIFSDDPKCRTVGGDDPVEDMRLMSRYDKIVISNSTFSWWAAYLSSATVIVAPEKWYTDGRGMDIPERWWIG